jgi:hypothetical protein
LSQIVRATHDGHEYELSLSDVDAEGSRPLRITRDGEFVAMGSFRGGHIEDAHSTLLGEDTYEALAACIVREGLVSPVRCLICDEEINGSGVDLHESHEFGRWGACGAPKDCAVKVEGLLKVALKAVSKARIGKALVAALAILATACVTFRDPWPTRPDGSPLPAKCVVDGPVRVGDDGIPRRSWAVVEGCDVEPEPDPAPTATPTPTPTPGPVVDPTPTPTPPFAEDCPPVSAFRCSVDVDGRQFSEIAVVMAIQRTIATRPDYLEDVELRSDGHVRARIRTRDPDAEPDLRAWTEDVAWQLRLAGHCAYSGDPNGRSPDEILIAFDEPRRTILPSGDVVTVFAEQWDLAMCGSIDPDGRYCVGSDLWDQTHDCTSVDESGPGLGPGGPDTGPVLCKGFGEHAAATFNHSWIHHRGANMVEDHWLPIGHERAMTPSQQTEVGPSGELRWSHPRSEAPWYATNPVLGLPYPRQRHEDGLEYHPRAGLYIFPSWLAYYGAADGSGCPVCTKDSPCPAEPPIARVRP